ncbi:FHA domain-containing protein [Roseimaritima ulvae]|uniref:FHA domain protein n=1 Tax=Roseimaritima ulvae TaxID=980254 RepID=A0A5B9QM59_9BACT|nr:FHA domain-containing protein [Roseimaritima ulvae]QEG38106.1 FHA domain protein [Roseimaritima ulvae]
MNQPSIPDSEEEPVIQTVTEPLQQFLKQAAQPSEPTSSKTQQPGSVLPFRPVNRQPLAILTVLDDGNRETGETIRIRDSKFTIGREKGDLTLPFDGDLSGHHAELRCQKHKGRFRWFLLDKKSTNGSFVRAVRASLSRQSELILGGRRYRFQLPAAGHDPGETDALQTQAYRAPTRTLLEQHVPRLSETGRDEKKGRSFSLAGEAFMGTDSDCQIIVDDDPCLNPKHARFYQDSTERWMVEDQKSLNGVWIRVKKFALDKQTEFQLGQQRFRFQPSSS